MEPKSCVLGVQRSRARAPKVPLSSVRFQNPCPSRNFRLGFSRVSYLGLLGSVILRALFCTGRALEELVGWKLLWSSFPANLTLDQLRGTRLHDSLTAP